MRPSCSRRRVVPGYRGGLWGGLARLWSVSAGWPARRPARRQAGEIPEAAAGGEPLGFAAAFPGLAAVFRQGAAQAQLDDRGVPKD